MRGLPRRWLRELTYLTLFVLFVMSMMLFANHHKIIALQNYIPNDLIPSFFQPKDTYIIDIAIEDCFNIKKGKPCGIPKSSSGRLGNLGDHGGWIQIEKDLALGTSWIKKQYFSYKNVKHEGLYSNAEKEGNNNEFGDNIKVIVDIAIAEPKTDSIIEGNDKLKIPAGILKDFWKSNVEGYEDLVDVDSYAENLKDEETEPKETNEEEAQRKEAEEDERRKSEIQEAAANVENNNDEKSSKRELGRHELVQSNQIPTKDEIKNLGWVYKSYNIWVKYGSPLDPNAITGIDILFGDDAVDPRPNWELIAQKPLKDVITPSGKSAYLTIRRGPKLDYKAKKYQPTLKFNKEGKFKILQVADLHFSTGYGKCRDTVPESSKKGCMADPRTLEFLEKVLEIEKPDFVVLTGDQIFGDESPDAETSIFKALNPFISRKIPFAVTMGNHDDEGSLTREEAMELSANLPYSLAAMGTEEVIGVGNYGLTVEESDSKNLAMTMYFLDTHKYSLNPKIKGYDWIRVPQLKWLEFLGDSYKSMKAKEDILSMAFFHIPLPEYRNLNQPFTGQNKEGVTAPKYNSGARSVLAHLGVQVVSVGHDHCNDYCLLDTLKLNDDRENKMWLCYGGGSGEGGYGGYDNYIRRMRIFELDSNKGEIRSWKRAQNNPEADFDFQILVSEGNAVVP